MIWALPTNQEGLHTGESSRVRADSRETYREEGEGTICEVWLCLVGRGGPSTVDAAAGKACLTQLSLTTFSPRVLPLTERASHGRMHEQATCGHHTYRQEPMSGTGTVQLELCQEKGGRAVTSERRPWNEGS